MFTNRSLYAPLASLFIAGILALIADAPALTLWAACLGLLWVVIWYTGALVESWLMASSQSEYVADVLKDEEVW